MSWPELAAGCQLPITVQPNAGMPRRLGRQLRYAHNTEYFAEFARTFVADGRHAWSAAAAGPRPAHIRAVARAVSGLTPARPLARPAPRRRAAACARAVPARPRGPPVGLAARRAVRHRGRVARCRAARTCLGSWRRPRS